MIKHSRLPFCNDFFACVGPGATLGAALEIEEAACCGLSRSEGYVCSGGPLHFGPIRAGIFVLIIGKFAEFLK